MARNVPDAHLVAVGETGVRQVTLIDLEHGDIRLGVDPEHPGPELTAVIELHEDGLGGLVVGQGDDMAVGDDVTVGVDDRAGAQAGRHHDLARLAVDLHIAGVDAPAEPAQDLGRDDLGGADADHGRHDAREHVGVAGAGDAAVDRAGVGLEGHAGGQQRRQEGDEGEEAAHDPASLTAGGAKASDLSGPS